MKKGQFSKLIVIFVILVNMIFAFSTLKVIEKTGTEPNVLIGAFFSFTTAELWNLAKIKSAKENKKARQ